MTATVTRKPRENHPAPDRPEERQRWPARLWGVLIVLSLVLFLDGLDVSMVGVALPSIGAELGLGTSSLQWIVSGYVLGYGGFLLLGGRTADLLGRRRVFLAALAVFALASLLGGLVDSGPLLIATRFVKGVSAAFTAPTGLSIITTTFAEGRARNRALSIYTVFGASGYSSGLIFGGLMTGLGWRWTFLMPVPIAAAALVAAHLLIPRDRPAAGGGHDPLGALTSTGAMLLLVYNLVSAPERGWTAPVTLALFAAVAALLAAFVAVERRLAHPLVRLGILRKGTLVRANAAIVALFGSYLSFQFIVTLYLQDVLGWEPLTMALALLPAGLLVALSAPYAGSMIDRFGTARFIIGGMAALTAGYVLFLPIGTDPVYLTAVLPSVVLLGVGFALGFPAINVQATSGIHDDEQGLAAGLVQTSGQVGAALVLAVTTALITADGTGDGSAQAMLDAFRPGLVFVTFVALAGLAIVLVPLLRRRSAETVPVTAAAEES
ncbi:Predicted arabinose efflux permease, MFS family [Thermomonospora echinospora]|uniref:Predicted arabinose efflux permease, MFS family n=1 Tax=Thermomonospora echinospora TaxID=1992 RepID=A0A1H5TJL8_9ACTN|nr:MFS transporter [Thermomonospora echinospora]SEF62207.1 Predicted arabinose efflux permease, MFS family [Thermomonospora echinospora]